MRERERKRDKLVREAENEEFKQVFEKRQKKKPHEIQTR